MEQPDFTCKRLLDQSVSERHNSDIVGNYVDACIWSSLEPNMAVVCACIPSLRPLLTILAQSVFNHPLIKSTLQSASSTSSKRIWRSSKNKTSDGTFSQLEDREDLRPLGYDASVHGGRLTSNQQAEEAIEIPSNGIQVQTEVTLTTSDRLYYNDRLY